MESKAVSRAKTSFKLAEKAQGEDFSEYRSVDFEEPDNPALRKHYDRQTLITLIDMRQELFVELMDENVMRAFIIAFGTCVGAALIPAILVIFLAPNTIGSGMTDVISFLNGNYNMESYSLLGTAVRLIGVFGICVAGFFTGFDGPFAQIGSSIGVLTVVYIKKSHFLRRIFYGEAQKKVDNTKGASELIRERFGWNSLLSSLEAKRLRLFTTLGASVAITAIFRSPVGGVMFALEETSSYLDLPTLWSTLFCTVLTYLIVCYQIVKTLGVADGDDLKKHFDLQQAVHFPVGNNCAHPIPYQDFVAYAFMAVLAALLSQFWNVILGKVQKLRLTYVIRSHDKEGNKLPELRGGKKWTVAGIRVAEIIVVCLITSAITVFVPTKVLDECTNVYIPTKHIIPTMPEYCAQLTDLATLDKCLKSISDVCIPDKLTDSWRTNLLNSFSNSSALVTTGTTSSTTTAAANVHRRAPAPTATAKSSASVNTKAESSYSSSDDKKKKQADILSTAAKKYALANPEYKLLPYYSFPKDGLLGEPDKACYYEIKSLLFKSPEYQLKFILKRGLFALWSSKTLTVFLFIYLVMSALTYYVALPTDLVIPNLIIGAIAGRMYGLMINWFKTLPVFGHTIEDPGVWAMLGMAAAWSGTSRLTLTVVIICLELTGDFENIPGLLTVTVIAAMIGRYLGPSLYHVELENNGVPFLEHDPGHGMHSRTIEGVIAVPADKLFVLREEETIARIREALASGHGSFPVVSETTVKERVFLKPVGLVLHDRLSEAVNGLESGKLIKGIRQDDIEVLERRFPVADLMNVSPSLVREGTSVAKAFKLVRSLGLKTILVIDSDGFLMGIVTRKDLIRLERLLHHEHKMHKKHGHGDHNEHGEDHHELHDLTPSLPQVGHSPHQNINPPSSPPQPQGYGQGGYQGMQPQIYSPQQRPDPAFNQGYSQPMYGQNSSPQAYNQQQPQQQYQQRYQQQYGQQNQNYGHY
ncbi:hypothetical protein HK098_005791 [Nowakowskiella sp. JEL0407]|nr:hypothetical protein HK098_005791 [Nowakowskiella sp. JEL0407]